MKISVLENKEELGRAAAAQGLEFIREAVRKRGEANIIVATGASQFEMLAALAEARLDWTRVRGFHLDEYIGLSDTHPASFRKYLRERFVEKVSLMEFHYVNGEADPGEECRRLNAILGEQDIDVAFIGIGENGHLAFNDPPADFSVEDPYIQVDLDEVCRMQQFKEGWFPAFEDVPQKALSMSVKQILKSAHIICTVPDERKSLAVRCAVAGPVTEDCPASILQKHGSIHLFLDHGAASRL